MHFVLNVLLVAVAAQYVIGPIVVLLTYRAPDPITLPIIDWETFANAQPPRFAAAHAAMLDLGFAPIAATGLRGVAEGLYELAGDTCSGSLMIAKSMTIFEFAQQYEDGSILCLTNSPLPSAYPRWTKKIYYRMPRVSSAKELFDAFTRLRNTQASATAARIPAAKRIANSEAFYRVETAHLVDVGILSRSLGSNGRRTTLWGACFMTWRLAWPSKAILNLLDQRRAQAAAA